MSVKKKQQQQKKGNRPTHLVQQLWNLILLISCEISCKITDDHLMICLQHTFSYFRQSLCHFQILDFPW